MKKYCVLNESSAIQESVRDLTCEMAAKNEIQNISLEPHSNPEFIWICVG